MLNFTPVTHFRYRLALPDGGRWREVINSDSTHYDGSGQGNLGGITAEPRAHMELDHSAIIKLPPLAGLILVPEDGGER